MTDDRWLEFADEPTLTDCDTFLRRLLHLDPTVLVRLQRGEATVSSWAEPGAVLVRRDLPGRLGVPDLTVTGRQLRERLSIGRVALPPSADAAWRVTLPPRSGWVLVDDVPVGVLRELAGRSGRPEDVVLTVASEPAAGEPTRVSVPLRLATALDRLGFLPAADGELVRVAATRAWTRLATRLGTGYDRRTERTWGLR